MKYIEEEKNNTIEFTIGLTEIIGAGDYRLKFLYRDNIEKLKLTDVQEVAKKYFKKQFYDNFGRYSSGSTFLQRN